jgi:lipoprotein-anchoring transpeptidase ErfK/SrfK
MKSSISRRSFLKLSGLALGSLALSPYEPPFPRPVEQDQGKLARVGTKEIDLRTEPRDTAPIVGKRYRDQLVHIYAEVIPEDAPQFYNRLWYRVWGGYLHSAHLQIVDIRHNQPLNEVPEHGVLCEVTVPYTIAYQYNDRDGWYPWRGSRLYYESTHWITGVREGPNGEPWYQITSELSKTEVYYAPAVHLRPIPPEELAPISPDVPPEKKKITVSIREQRLRAFEDGEEVLSVRISSGIPSRPIPGELPTATPTGRFRIYSKMPSKHMGSIAGGPEVEERSGFSLPGVPWTMFFAEGGYALHGTYWHNNFGLQMSHGCVNMRNEDARWLFRWTTPVFPAEITSQDGWERTGNGTLVEVFD